MGSNCSILKVAFLLIGVSALHGGTGAQTTSPKVVLELFTSQGCSSCPPADALLESYTKRDDEIALSVPVDYWDRLGWKDTYASRDHTDRQQDYASARRDGQIYTPQVVVSGSAPVVGSSRSGIDNAIAAVKKSLRDSQVAVSAREEGGTLVVQVGPAPVGAAISDARLLLAAIQDSGTVSIRRGENANRNVNCNRHCIASVSRLATQHADVPKATRGARDQQGRVSRVRGEASLMA